MKKKVIVLSLGGSLIVPDEIDHKFIDKFKKTILNNTRKNKFVVVCGGGSIARKYIDALKKQRKTKKEQAYAGIRVTRMNAKTMTQIFGKISNKTIPKTIKEINSQLKKNDVVFCGALRYAENETSDSAGAKIAKNLKANFINLTNVKGLYTSDPRKNKNAKLIKEISWEDFRKEANKIKYTPGQHFVLDQQAAKIIQKNKIKTIILGNDMKNFEKAINGGKFIGTTIENDQ